MQQVENQLAIFFENTDNILLVKMVPFQDRVVLIDAEIDFIDGLDQSIDLLAVGPYLYVASSVRSGTKDLFSRDPVDSRPNDRKSNSDSQKQSLQDHEMTDEAIIETQVVKVFKLEPSKGFDGLITEEVYGQGIYRASDDNFNMSKYAETFEYHFGQAQIFIKFLRVKDEAAVE